MAINCDLIDDEIPGFQVRAGGRDLLQGIGQ